MITSPTTLRNSSFLLLLAFVSVLTLPAVSLAAKPQSVIGKPVDEFTLPNCYGKQVALSHHSDKDIVVPKNGGGT